MKASIVYRDKSDHGRVVRDFLRDFERQTGKKITEIDPDSHEGIALCQSYDIVEYPTVLATDDQGVMQQMWRGVPLPTISELSYYS